MSKRLALLTLLVASWSAPVAGALLEPASLLEAELEDGTRVVAYASVSDSDGYYYLPTNPRLAVAEDGKPEFALRTYVLESDEDQGDAAGALLNLRVTWGLTPAQEGELAALLGRNRPGAKLLGALPLTAAGAERSFRLVSGTLDSEGSEAAVLTGGFAPLLPGGRVAVAARLDSHQAQILRSTLEGATTLADLSLILEFGYDLAVPAARGSVSIDWRTLEREGESLLSGYGGACLLGRCRGNPTGQTTGLVELERQYRYLIRQGVIRFHWDEAIPDDRLAEIESTFFERFLELVADIDPGRQTLSRADRALQRLRPGARFADRYRPRWATGRSRPVTTPTQHTRLDVRLPVRREHQLVANLKSWYEAVREDPRCVETVRVDQWFDSIRTVPFLLSLGGEEIFDEAIRHVQITLRKRRAGGRDFLESKTLDRDVLRRDGPLVSLDYPRSEAESAAFEYLVKWTLRDGTTYPVRAEWREGTWQGVTLTPPVRPRSLELEGDLVELQAAGFTRATVKIRYWSFGRETEATLRLRLRGEPYVTERVLVDRDSAGYAMRLIYQHREHGAMALAWRSWTGGDYLYAALPAELLTNAAERSEAQARAAADMMGEDAVLSRFPELRPQLATTSSDETGSIAPVGSS